MSIRTKRYPLKAIGDHDQVYVKRNVQGIRKQFGVKRTAEKVGYSIFKRNVAPIIAQVYARAAREASIKGRRTIKASAHLLPAIRKTLGESAVEQLELDKVCKTTLAITATADDGSDGEDEDVDGV